MTSKAELSELVSGLYAAHSTLTAVTIVDTVGQIVACAPENVLKQMQPIAGELNALLGQAELIERMGGRGPTQQLHIQGNEGGFVYRALDAEYRLMLCVDPGGRPMDVPINLAFATGIAENAADHFKRDAPQ